MFGQLRFPIVKFMKSPALVLFLFVATLLVALACTPEAAEEAAVKIKKTVEARIRGEEAEKLEELRTLVTEAETDYLSLTSVEGAGKFCPLCPGPYQNTEDWFQRMQSDWLGVFALDPVGHYIGEEKAWSGTGYGFSGWSQAIQSVLHQVNKVHWTPIDGTKRILCGKLHDFKIFDPKKNWAEETAEEMDWNLYIIPTDYHKNAIDLADGEPTHDCDGTNDCMEGEVSPDEERYYTEWFPKINNDKRQNPPSPLEGKLICMYGPWVGDGGHDNRPEIHPSELIWWRSTESLTSVELRDEGTVRGGEGSYYLMVVQDDSNRYDKEFRDHAGYTSGYTCPSGGECNGRPWSATPRTAKFRVAFEIEADAADPIYFGIQDHWSKNVVTGLFNDAVPGKNIQEPWMDSPPDKSSTHGLALDGKLLVEVEELQENDKDIGVQFEDLCRYEKEDGKTYLRGFIALTTMIGGEKDGEEGFQVLEVYTGKKAKAGLGTSSARLDGKVPGFALMLMQNPSLKPVIRPVPCTECLRLARNDKKSQLITDIEYQANLSPDENLSDFTISSVNLVTDRQSQKLEFEAPRRLSPGNPRLGVAKNVPIMYGGLVELKMESGRNVYIPLPDVSVAPLIVRESVGVSERDPNGWRAILAALKEHDSKSDPPTPVMSAQHWEIEVGPRYAPLKDDRPSPEDESPLEERLREVLLEGDRERMLRVFGSEQPFAVDWSFKAINLVSGNEVPVTIGREASTREVSVRLEDGIVPDGVLQVVFPEPSAGATYELTASVNMTDTLGTEWQIQHKLYSHILSVEPTEKVLDDIVRTVADLAEISPDELISAASFFIDPEDASAQEDLFSTGARIVRLRSLYAAQDQRMTIGELSGILRVAKLVRNR